MVLTIGLYSRHLINILKKKNEYCRAGGVIPIILGNLLGSALVMHVTINGDRELLLTHSEATLLSAPAARPRTKR